MARAAARLGTDGYEEVIERAGGPRALRLCQAALFLLLFGSSCTCLAVIQETATRAVAELAVQTGGAELPTWLSATAAGQATLTTGLTCLLLLPLSLASMGELLCASLLGVGMMLVLCGYVLYLAFCDDASAVTGVMGVAGAAQRTVGYTDAAVSFVQRPTLSQLRALTLEALTLESVDDGPGEQMLGEQLRADPPDWRLRVPTAASTFGYAFYIQPCALPLLRTLPTGDAGAAILTNALHVTFLFTTAAYTVVGIGGLSIFGDGRVPQDLLQGFHGDVGGVLSALFCLYLCLCFPPIVVPLREVLNAILTAVLVGCALLVALLLPDASSTLFALTGATGVCCVSYIFPIFAYWSLSEEEGGLRRGPAASTLTIVLAQRVWPALVLLLGISVSALTLVGFVSSIGAESPTAVCVARES